jgi:predicted N-acyltransferase
MNLTIHNQLDDIPSATWNQLLHDHHPFLRHEFLSALEHTHCVGESFGWLPQHIALYDNQQLIGATPLYLKYNSYGEFVFDWSWAEAYERAGLAYYPKLVSAIPYTPATGQRLLVHPQATPQQAQIIRRQLIQGALQHAESVNVSSLHWLFPDMDDAAILSQEDRVMRRIDCQFHWHNHNYRDFDEFLQRLSAKKRKNIRQERRNAQSAGLRIELVSGDQATGEQLQAAELFYRTTFDKKWGHATLNLTFFEEIARTMGEQLILMLARDESRYVAGAICLRSDHTLYGRHWGCIAEYHSLHFELCYYQGIEYCIREGLQRFEPGAQGEHKLSRGFLPTMTHSYHWIENLQFRSAIEDFLQRETKGIQHYMDELGTHNPYKNGQ